MHGQEFADSHGAVNLRGVGDEVERRVVELQWLGQVNRQRRRLRKGRVEPLWLARRRYFIRRRGRRDSWGNAIECLSRISYHSSSLNSLNSLSITILNPLPDSFVLGHCEC